jgi:hypothetical protein
MKVRVSIEPLLFRNGNSKNASNYDLRSLLGHAGMDEIGNIIMI